MREFIVHLVLYGIVFRFWCENLKPQAIRFSSREDVDSLFCYGFRRIMGIGILIRWDVVCLPYLSQFDVNADDDIVFGSKSQLNNMLLNVISVLNTSPLIICSAKIFIRVAVSSDCHGYSNCFLFVVFLLVT